MKKMYYLSLLLCSIFVSSHASAMAILNFDDDGYLTSISNFSFQNKTYDVSIVAGTCAELYNGCTNDTLPFPHTTMGDSTPMTALHELRIAIAEADTRIFSNEYNRFYLKENKYSGLALPWKEWYLPNSEESAKLVDTAFVYTEQGAMGGANDYLDRNSFRYNYTVWTEVPEPSTYMLLLLGSLALVANRKRTYNSRC